VLITFILTSMFDILAFTNFYVKILKDTLQETIFQLL